MVILTQPPERYVRRTGGDNERSVYASPQPWVFYGRAVVVNGGRYQNPDHPVLDQDVSNGEEERQPILIQHQNWDDHEELEVRLDRTPRQVNADRCAGEEPGRRERRPDLPAPEGLRSPEARDQHRAYIDGKVLGGDTSEQTECKQTQEVESEEYQDRAVPAFPLGL
ncbi:MAG TPA: hypothetical protein VIN56_07485 [Candidatus Dormibacteraeota bacterium]